MKVHRHENLRRYSLLNTRRICFWITNLTYMRNEEKNSQPLPGFSFPSNGCQELFLWGWGGRGVRLTAHFHLVPRSRNEWSYTISPIRPHGVVLKTKFIWESSYRYNNLPKLKLKFCVFYKFTQLFWSSYVSVSALPYCGSVHGQLEPEVLRKYLLFSHGKGVETSCLLHIMYRA
jgi:hypothetical protein